ncbi:MAG: DUF1853 family protein [Vicingaceae bacterium]
MKRHNTFQEDIQQIRGIRNPLLRDLLALLWSEAVFNDQLPSELRFQPPNLSLINFIQWVEGVGVVEEYIDVSKLPLGKYAEKLLQMFFEHHPNFKLIAQNIQLVKDKLTVGEIDYLLYDLKKDKHIHLEFALKFYLQTVWKGKVTFLGPNVKDSLSKKSQKLIKRQSQLLIQHADLLPTDLRSIDFQPQIWMKGVRFYPFQGNENYTHSRAWWLNIENIEFLQQADFTFELINHKKDWIFPYYKASSVEFETLSSKAKKYLEQKANALMVVRRKGGEVVDRGFIMRTDWPN